ncbi:MAG: hypothetical protein HYS87_01910 [Candidatus Colwellbacteria bacterium]|nr:hypothetical protein [Candidatus Colwellbacteria bacterium]
MNIRIAIRGALVLVILLFTFGVSFAHAKLTFTSTSISSDSTLGVTSTNFNINSAGVVTSATWNGNTVGVAYGGTGATTAAGARTNLGATTVGDAVFTAADAAAARAAIGVGSGTGDLVSTNNLSDLTNAGTARSNLGLGSLATLSSIGTANIDNTAVTFAKIQNISTARILGRTTAGSGAIEELESVPIALGGTGATTASAARTNLGATTVGDAVFIAADAAAARTALGVGLGIGDLVSTNNLSDLANAATARTNLGLGSLATLNSIVYQNQTLKTGAKIWTGSATTSSGVATFNPTDDNTASGTAIFTNVYSIQATAEGGSTPITSPLASIRTVSGDNKTITIAAVTGTNLGALGNTVGNAPDGTTVYLTIIGD